MFRMKIRRELFGSKCSILVFNIMTLLSCFLAKIEQSEQNETRRIDFEGKIKLFTLSHVDDFSRFHIVVIEVPVRDRNLLHLIIRFVYI